MALPADQVKVNVDAATDDPKLARGDFANNVDKFNALKAALGNIVELNAGAGLKDDGAGNLAVDEAADSGLEFLTGRLRVKTQSNGGIERKASDAGIGLSITGLTAPAGGLDFANDKLFVWDNSAGLLKIIVGDDLGANSLYPPGHLSGCRIKNNTVDLVNDLDFLSGSCLSEDGTANIDLTSTLVKKIDVDWVVGSNQGGFPSALTLATATWYHCFLIKRSDTGVVDAGFDTSLTAANLLSDAGVNYDEYRRVGAIYRVDGTIGIRPFAQNGDLFSVYGVRTNRGDPTDSRTLITLSALVPPGVKVDYGFTVQLIATSDPVRTWVGDPDSPDFAVTTSNYHIDGSSSPGLFWDLEVTTNTSQQYARRRQTDTPGTVTFWETPRFYRDRRGKEG
jgi:hypothetical protein